MIAGQDNARSTMNQITRDLQDAMVVYDGLPVYMYGYTAYKELNGRPHPYDQSKATVVRDPVTGEPIEYPDAIIDMVLPKARYYCTRFDHYLTDAEAVPNQAIEFCPRHPNSPVETRPIEPLQPAGTRVRYFIGLRNGYVNPSRLDPGVPDAGTNVAALHEPAAVRDERE